MGITSGMYQKDAFCSFCGSPFPADVPLPRTCAHCGNTTYRNPLPVAVVLVPVEGKGLLLIRRGIEPRRGQLALPGGFIGVGESWQQAGAREVLEETGAVLDPDAITLFDARSAPDGTLLVFGLAPPLAAGDVPDTPPDDDTETEEIFVAREPVPLAFPLHTQAAAKFWAG